MRWGGLCAFILVCLMLAMDSAMKLLLLKPAVDANALLGFDRSGTFEIGVCLALCLLLYVVPRTRLLGAILLTGYLGGAVAAHLRAGSSLVETLFPVFAGVLVWGALFWLSPEARRLPWFQTMY
jgi:DoxX-like family